MAVVIPRLTDALQDLPASRLAGALDLIEVLIQRWNDNRPIKLQGGKDTFLGSFHDCR